MHSNAANRCSRPGICRVVLLAMLSGSQVGAIADGATEPSYDCSRAESSVEELICSDEALASLDRQLAQVWNSVLSLSRDMVDLPMVKAEQRGWIKGRNDCWKDNDVRGCVENSYKKRIAELQARWRLVGATGPVFFACDGNPANEIVATFFASDPPAAILERGDSSAVTYLVRSGSGAKYEGQNLTFWNKGLEATVTWGYDSEPMTCVVRKITR